MQPIPPLPRADNDVSQTGRTTHGDVSNLDNAMIQWLVSELKQQILFPDPDDPAANPTPDSSAGW
ncbi:hypothetical protein KDW07_14640 [Burkholderia dolosa]|uniref:hypothetical protein n=1 Tax=Burkholderia dolosa TaxID=152500 RepID=UPI00159257BA|nr:hypothetical protein [Burkholderia dolosa]MBR8458382.1 hypothetical protein [Burkholderia dolosa]